MTLRELIEGKEENLKEETVSISERFREEGKEVPWVLKPVDGEKWSNIKKEKDPWTGLMAETVLVPDLKDRKLQESYGARDDRELLTKMLYAGEYNRLLRKVKEVNRFQERKNEQYKKAKN